MKVTMDTERKPHGDELKGIPRKDMERVIAQWSQWLSEKESAEVVALRYAVRASKMQVALATGIASARPKVSGVSLIQNKNATRATRSIRYPPGIHMARLAKWVFPRKMYEQIYEPQIADMRLEYYEALREGAEWKAKWIRAYYMIAFAKTIVASIPVRLIKVVLELLK